VRVIVDIANPPTGGLSLQPLYRLITQFRVELIAENERLRALDVETKRQWELMGRGRLRGMLTTIS
ncbi:hypothetical protein SCLCIDRAFT_145256, partial [Scleroderma citrinum Foug A]